MKSGMTWWINLTVWAFSSLVYAAAPPDRYTYPSAGVVYDTRTKLTWQQDASSVGYPQEEAQGYCDTLSLAGFGWRVPTMPELLSLVDLTEANPAIDKTAFSNTPADASLWSSSTPEEGIGYGVNFLEGKMGASGTGAKCRVRCVR